MKRASRSRSSSLGVVPDAMSAWNPLMEPHAMVMNAKGKSAPAKIGPGAVGEPRERGHLQRRQRDEDADRERDDDADLHERGEIVARREQQPHREHGRREAVRHHEERERPAAQRERRRQRRLLGDPASRVQRDDEQHDADRARLEHASGPDPAHVETHEHRDRDRQADRHRAPRDST